MLKASIKLTAGFFSVISVTPSKKLRLYVVLSEKESSNFKLSMFLFAMCLNRRSVFGVMIRF